MNAQQSFFDTAADVARDVKAHRKGRARKTDPDTSQRAARAFPVNRANQRGRILLYLSATAEGATAEQLWKSTGGAYPHVAHTRCMELADLSLVELTSETRATASATAHVWKITPAGSAVAEQLARTEAAA